MLITVGLILTLCVISESKNYTLEELKHVFDPPHPRDKSVVYRNTTRNINCDNITKLLLYFDTDTDLTFLSTCHQLNEFWFVYRNKNDRFRNPYYALTMGEISNSIVQKIHINVYTDFKNYINILKNMTNVEILDLSEAGFILNKNNLLDIISHIISPLVALSLDNCLYLNFNPDFYILNITEVFVPLKHQPLEYLSMRNIGLAYISGHFLDIFPRLRILDICENFIHTTDKAVQYELLVFHQHLQVLCSSYLQRRDFVHHHLENAFSGDSGLLNQDYIQHNWESLSIFDENLTEEVLQCVKKLRLTINQIYTNRTALCVIASCFLDYSSEWLLDHGFCDNLPTLSSLRNTNCPSQYMFPVISSLKEFHIENKDSNDYNNYKSFIKGTICLANNNIETFGLKNVGVKYLITRLTKVKSFYMEQTGIVNISIATINDLPSLENFKILGGQINFTINRLERNLTSFILSYVQIKELPFELVSDCLHMKVINISGNELRWLDLDISKLQYLQVLDVSSNPLQFLSRRTISGLMQGRNRLTLYLSNTQLSCGCGEDAMATTHFILDAQKYNVNIINFENLQCDLNYQSITISNSSILSLMQSQCSNLYLIIGLCSVNVFLIAVILATYSIYRCRYRIYTGMLRHKWQQNFKKATNTHYIYDVYVCYCAADRFWVHNVLMKELEGKYGLRLCIHYRDFGFGCISDMIITKLTESRCVIFTLSCNSLKSDWCERELQFAYSQSVTIKKPLIVVKLGQLSKNMVKSALIQQFLDSHIYIKWPDLEPDSKKSKEIVGLFWAKLTSSLYDELTSYLTCCRSYFGYRALNEAADDDQQDQESNEEYEDQSDQEIQDDFSNSI